MPKMPVTSVSLIRDVSNNPASARWTELYRAYLEPMRSFLAAKYPSLEPDDVIQETMVALFERMPRYKYLPDEKGHFRNYLAGILKHKAADAIARRARAAGARESLRAEAQSANENAVQSEAWRLSALEVAISQLLADDSVAALHRSVFRHVALMREKPEDVARSFGISRANVDQIKRRMTARLGEAVRKMTD